MTEWITPLLAVAAGILLLMYAGGRLVKHAAHLAMSLRVPKTVVGAVILGFGTSLPELCVSLNAALTGSPDIATGNVVGSNIANVGLVLGFGAVLVTMYVERRVIRVDLPFGVLAALFMLLFVGPLGEVSRLTGAGMLVAFAIYMTLSVRYARRYRRASDDVVEVERHPVVDCLWMAAGLVGIAFGADVLVDGASATARLVGVSERVIAVTMVAIGTSLPELAAIFAAARRHEHDLAVGNVVGSNIFNLLFVLSSTAIVTPVPVHPVLVARDLPAMVVFSVLAFPIFVRRRQIGWVHGTILLLAYVAYIVWTGTAAQ